MNWSIDSFIISVEKTPETLLKMSCPPGRKLFNSTELGGGGGGGGGFQNSILALNITGAMELCMRGSGMKVAFLFNLMLMPLP